MELKLCMIFLLNIATTSGFTKKVLLISMDGFRWDYVDKTETPNFDRFIKQGVRVRQMQDAFSSVTLPNHWTIVTGQYEEDTGIIDNRMWDPVYKEEFIYGSDTKWFNETEPIWITAVKEDLISGAYMWVGNQAVYDGVMATKVVPYSSPYDFKEAVTKVAGWFANDSMNLACLYMNQPDGVGHRYGPDSEETEAKIRDMDGVVGHLLQEFDDNGLTNEVNVIIVSDHGMATISSERAIDLSQYVDEEDVEWWSTWVIGHIFPKAGKEMKIYNALKDSGETHMQVYLKENIPEQWHYKNHRRIPPIFLVADEGWIMTQTNQSFEDQGGHGYDNTLESMKATFLARGPDFKSGYKQNDMLNLDIHPLLCKLLGLSTCPKGPGSLSRTADMLSLNVTSSASHHSMCMALLAIIILAHM